MVDYFIGKMFADAGNETAAQIFPYPVNCGGQFGFGLGDFELLSVLFIYYPVARDFQSLATLHSGENAGDRDCGFLFVGFEVAYKEVIFLVGIDDALKDACYCLRHGDGRDLRLGI